MDTKPIGPFLGINNRLPDFALATKEGYWLRAAENVDIDNAGMIRRRDGETLVQAMTGAHSLSPDNKYLVRDSVLYEITLPTYSETLIKLLASNAAVSWVEHNGVLFYSNGTDSGKLISGAHYPMALPTPQAPACSVASGTMARGTYQVSVAYVNSTTGEEGGVSASSAFELATESGITVMLPATVAGATHINVYVSFVNGSVPLLYSTVTTGTTSILVDGKPEGREANQRYEAPLPAGHLFIFNGALCSFSGNNIHEGIPVRHGYYLPSSGRIPFASEVTNAVPAQNGVYVTADNTYWISGRVMTGAEVVNKLLPYGAYPGTSFALPHSKQVGWFGANGFVIGDEMGQVLTPMQTTVDVAPAFSSCPVILETRGCRRAVAFGYCMNLETSAVTTYTDFAFSSCGNGYATKADGLYALTGDKEIAATVSLGRVNFGSENIKFLPACYLGVSSSEKMELLVSTPAFDEYQYETRGCSEELRMQRIDPGKGLRASWFDLSVRNTEGADFILASVSFAPVASGRRI